MAPRPRTKAEEDEVLDALADTLRLAFPKGFVILAQGSHSLHHRESAHEFMLAATRHLHRFTVDGSADAAGPGRNP